MGCVAPDALPVHPHKKRNTPMFRQFVQACSLYLPRSCLSKKKVIRLVLFFIFSKWLIVRIAILKHYNTISLPLSEHYNTITRLYSDTILRLLNCTWILYYDNTSLAKTLFQEKNNAPKTQMHPLTANALVSSGFRGCYRLLRMKSVVLSFPSIQDLIQCGEGGAFRGFSHLVAD